MGMALADLVADLKTSLHDSAAVFRAADDADFKRFLDAALPDFQFKRPLTRRGELALVPGVDSYPVAVSDFAALKTHSWGDGGARYGQRVLKPWEPGWPGAVPRVSERWDGQAWHLVLEPYPTAVQISAWGPTLPYWYFARHTLGATAPETTVNPLDRGLLLLRAQVEAMRELAIRNAAKPVSLRDGMSGTPRNSTPAALAEQLLKLFQEAR